MENLIDIEHKVMFQTYKRFPIVIKKAEGSTIWDNEGNEYLDFLAGIAVNALGHTHPKIIEAITNQAKKYMHVSNYFYQEPQILLAEKLVVMTSFDRVFFTNSGSEAMEGAIKLIRRYSQDKQKTEIIAFSGGFHGRTYGALSIMDKPHYKDKMGPFLEGTKIIEHNNIAALRDNINDKTAAVVLEFLQGEGGIVEPTTEFVSVLKELKDKYDFLLVADEIQCGVGRTGKFFGFENFNIQPDIVTMAKGIGGGLPLGVILAKEKLKDVWQKGNHGTTYGGNALACAAGMVVLNELEAGVMNNVEEVGGYLKSKLQEMKLKYPNLVTEVRGRGLMLGLVLSFDASILVEALLKAGIISNAASGNILRIVPPLVLKKEEAEIFIIKLSIALSKMQ